MAPLYLNFINYYWAFVYVTLLAVLGPDARDPKIRLPDTPVRYTPPFHFVYISIGVSASVNTSVYGLLRNRWYKVYNVLEAKVNI